MRLRARATEEESGREDGALALRSVSSLSALSSFESAAASCDSTFAFAEGQEEEREGTMTGMYYPQD